MAGAARGRSLHVAFGLFVLLAVASLVGPWLRPYDAWHTDWAQLQVAPGWQHGHWFGTDATGRDLFSRVVHGASQSISAALLAVFVGFAFGTLIAQVDEAGQLDMRYQQVSTTGQLRAGRCRSVPEVLAVQEAERAPPSTRAISPIRLPGPSTVTVTGLTRRAISVSTVISPSSTSTM